jgi:hypothetical protein
MPAARLFHSVSPTVAWNVASASLWTIMSLLGSKHPSREFCHEGNIAKYIFTNTEFS